MKKKVTILLAGLMAVIIPCQSVLAYRLNHWPIWQYPKQIKYYFAPSSSNVDVRIRNAVASGAGAWNTACSSINISQTTSAQTKPQITIRMTHSTDGSMKNTYAVTYEPTKDIASGYIANMSMYFNAAYSYLDDVGGAKSVAAHEFGHALGLDHASGAVLMNDSYAYVWTSQKINTPKPDDINGVKYIYK